MATPMLRSVVLWIAPALALGLPLAGHRSVRQDAPTSDAVQVEEEVPLPVHYLEIVTPDVEASCAFLEEVHGVSFGEPIPVFGGARTAVLAGGGRVGVRAPMRDTEEPIVRPYVLVKDIEAAVEAARASGAEIALPPMAIPEQGMFAIYISGGIEYGLWQL